MWKSFHLRWSHGARTFITAYIYDPLIRRESLNEWKKICIKFGEENGLKYEGEATSEEYINQ